MFAQGLTLLKSRSAFGENRLSHVFSRQSTRVALRRLSCAHRLFVPSSELDAVECAGSLELPPNEQQHVRSRRLKDGTMVELFDGSGRLAAGQLACRGRAVEALRWLPTDTGATEVPSMQQVLSVSCVVATPKSTQRADWMIEKLNELGVSGYRHLACRRVEVDAPQIEKRAAVRWQHVSIAAAKQSLRRTLLDCGLADANATVTRMAHWFPSPVVTLEDLVRQMSVTASEDVVFLLAKPDARRTLASWRRAHSPVLSPSERWTSPRQVVCVVGPEGGLSSDEEDALLQAGAIGVSLGAQRLRTETAAVALAAALLIA
ncbi:hypothetical protein F1559_004116 [Cyanidiococcus yangmingshanensis]|uniref:16S rRNA (uracil(1498)-N(3))-methyltransferase n=1 Tax=Cyanidiococcus yangmingshanensis TaxID=2690220 RepID=A0A7J7ILD3_9RHOD|nr:hypothetical protein F1559_004116 [Cyanidiococcus yangmingshanensis]